MTTPVDPFEAMEARQAEQAAEYGTWVAKEQVWQDSTLVYDVGHPIPASNVEADGSVVTVRHYCPPQLPGQDACTVENNKVLRRTEPGVAVKVKPAAKSAPAKSKES